MKLSISVLASVILLLGVMEGATAGCTDTQYADTTGTPFAAITLEALLSGNTVCVSNGSPKWENQELHVSDGTLVDYKEGPSDPVDPTKQVGTWSVSGNGTGTVVNYTYTDASGSSGTGPFTVHSADGLNLSFCQAGSEVVAATLKTGPGSCGTPP